MRTCARSLRRPVAAVAAAVPFVSSTVAKRRGVESANFRKTEPNSSISLSLLRTMATAPLSSSSVASEGDYEKLAAKLKELSALQVS